MTVLGAGDEQARRSTHARLEVDHRGWRVRVGRVGVVDGNVRGLEAPRVDLDAAPNVTGSRHTHLPRTWARLEIDDLTATKGHSARAEIIDLSRQYTVLSRYTALLVLENDAMFREFNVVRQAGRTTGWNGQLPAPVTTPPPVGQIATKTAGAGSSPVDASSSAAETASAPRPAGPADPTACTSSHTVVAP